MMMPQKPLSPCRTLITSFTPRKPLQPAPDGIAASAFEEGDWVLCLTTDREGYQESTSTSSQNSPETLACALSNGEIQIYDTQRLHVACSFSDGTSRQQTDAMITDIQYGPQHSLVSTSQNGCVDIYDLRQSQLGGQAKLPSGQQALCATFGFDGYLTAIGSSKARIHFYDLRKPSTILGSYVDSHRDDITQIAFSQTVPGLLLSGSEDGLMCIFDTTQPTEETALRCVMNASAPVRKMGFCGNTGTIYCLTGNETISLWNSENASLIHDFGWNTRQQLVQSALSTPSLLNSIDYLVDASWNNGKLLLLAGGTTTSPQAGNCALFSVTSSGETTTGSGNIVPSSWNFQHLQSLAGGHRGIVRAWSPLYPSTLATAGEDARICEWQTDPSKVQQQPAPPIIGPSTTPLGKRGVAGGGGPARRQRHKKSTSPY